MRNFVTVIGVLFCLFTCNMIGQLDLTDQKETPKKEIFVSIESDLPADLDMLTDSMARDIRVYARIPDIIHVMYGKYGNAIETYDSLRGANLISSHEDTLFILPIDPGLINHRVNPPIAHAIGMKLLEMVKK